MSWRSAVQRMAAASWFAKVGPYVAPRLDRSVNWLTRGRVMPSALYQPALFLTTTGSKSGLPRRVPLAYMPDGDRFVLLGSNFGREHHPAWSSNLLANPEATVEVKSTTIPVRARLATAEERAAMWPRVLKTWPAFDTYKERSGRDIRLFILERHEDAGRGREARA